MASMAARRLLSSGKASLTARAGPPVAEKVMNLKAVNSKSLSRIVGWTVCSFGAQDRSDKVVVGTRNGVVCVGEGLVS